MSILSADPTERLGCCRSPARTRRRRLIGATLPLLLCGLLMQFPHAPPLPPPLPISVQLLPAAPVPAEPPPSLEASIAPSPPLLPEAPSESLPPAAAAPVPEAPPVATRPPPTPQPRQARPVRPVPRTTARPLAAPTEIAPAPSPPAPPRAAPPPAATASPGEMAAFAAGMRAAIRAALVYPPAARMSGQSGEVRVAFDFLDGHAFNLSLAAASGLPLLDHAAMVTVAAARYPAPPVALAHKTLHLALAVKFDPSEAR